MTRVISRASPNWNARPPGVLIDTVVMHSTESRDTQQDITWLCTPAGPTNKNPASSHVVIDRDGTIYDLVAVQRRAWHAGVSSFEGRPDCNSYSIGIELANANDGEPYPDAQLAAAAALCASYCKEWPAITVERITTHAIVALPPGRKVDPHAPFNLADFQNLVREELDR